MRLPFATTTKALHGAFVVLVVTGVASASLAIPRVGADDAVLTSSATGRFQIRGQATGLYPGKTVPLRLTIVNRNGFAIVVKTVNVSVRSAGATCPAANLKVSRYRGKLVVPARRTKRLVLRATLAATAPDGCVDAQFPLRYRGTAVKR